MSRSSPAERANKIAIRRSETLQTFLQLKTKIGAGKSARAVRSSTPTIWRWQKAFASGGVEALRPKFSPGRPSAVEGIRLSPKAVRELERLIVSQGNVQRAWLAFSKTVHCPAAVARMNFRTMPAPVMRMVQLRPLQASCYVSATTGTLYFKIGKGGS